MHHFIRFVRLGVGPILLTLMLLLLAGCATNKPAAACGGATADKSASATTATPAITPTTAPPAVNIAPAAKAIRIRAGTTLPLTDSTGNVWQPDDGFADGETVERPDLAIANTKDPGLYQAERYSMTSFSWPLPNGKYTVKLHFAETYEGVTQAGERVFSFNVQGREFKDFDVLAKAGGAARAYVESVPTEITNGKLLITFAPQIENPQINGIEIIPGW
jgi:hypothetical protein